MGRRARRRVLRGMDVRRYAEAHVRLYEDLVRERRQWEAIKYQPPTSPVTSSTPTIPTVPTTPTPIIPPTPATLQAPTTPTTPTTPRADKGPLRTTIVNPVRIVSPGNGTALATSELLLRTSLTSLPPNHRLVVAVDGGALMRVDRTNGVMLGGLTPGHHRVSIFVVVASEHATPQYASTRGVTGGERGGEGGDVHSDAIRLRGGDTVEVTILPSCPPPTMKTAAGGTTTEVLREVLTKDGTATKTATSKAAKRAPLIIDSFTFFNEGDVLEMRLHELAGVVAAFILVEAEVNLTKRQMSGCVNETISGERSIMNINCSTEGDQ